MIAKSRLRFRTFVVGTTLLLSVAGYSQQLTGTTGSAAGPNWQSSWLDFKPSLTFGKGETLRLKLDGDAENVLIRFLSVGAPPEAPDGIEGDVRKVPASRVLDITLQRDHRNITQISVHAGKEVWGRALGGNNGSVRVVSIERVKTAVKQ